MAKIAKNSSKMTTNAIFHPFWPNLTILAVHIFRKCQVWLDMTFFILS